MKKTIILSLAVLMLLIGSTMFAQVIVTLDQAISYSVNEIETRLEQGAKVMVLNFESPSERLSSYVLDEIAAMLARTGKFSLIERANLEFLLWELKYEKSADISDETARAIGRILGAQYIISGTIRDLNSNYAVEIKTAAVEPTAIQTFIRVGVIKDAQIASLMGADASNVRVTDASNAGAVDVSSVRGTDNTSNVRVAQEYISNTRNNWISGEVTFFGLGTRYERMLNSKLSLGVNVYLNFLLFIFGVEGGIDASVRFYPLGTTFFVGAGLGFHVHGLFDTEVVGGAITPEIGWKIDVGNEGGFFLQPGIKYPITFGEKTDSLGYTESKFGVGFGFGVLYFGMGYAF